MRRIGFNPHLPLALIACFAVLFVSTAEAQHKVRVPTSMKWRVPFGDLATSLMAAYPQGRRAMPARDLR